MDVDMELLHCENCGVVFAMTSDMVDRRRKDHEGFYCPKGHSNVFRARTDEEILREKLKVKERELLDKSQQLEGARKSLREMEQDKQEQIRAFLKSFNANTKTVPVKSVADYFKLKSRDVMQIARRLGLTVQRSSDKQYHIVLKNKKEKK